MPENIEFIPKIRIFLGSPSDTRKERDKAEKIINSLNKETPKKYHFEIERWENLFSTSGVNPQTHINENALYKCDILLCFFKHKFGDVNENNIAPTQGEIEWAGNNGKKVALIRIIEEPLKGGSKDVDEQIKRLEEIKKVNNFLNDKKDWLFYNKAENDAELKKHIISAVNGNVESILKSKTPYKVNIKTSEKVEMASVGVKDKEFLLARHQYHGGITKILETSIEFRILNFTQDEWLEVCQSPEKNTLVEKSIGALKARNNNSTLKVFGNAYRLTVIPINKVNELLPVVEKIRETHKSITSVRNEILLTEIDFPSFKYTFDENEPESIYFVRRAIFYHNKEINKEICLYSIMASAEASPEYIYAYVDEADELFHKISKSCNNFITPNQENSCTSGCSMPILMTLENFFDTVKCPVFPSDRRKRVLHEETTN